MNIKTKLIGRCRLLERRVGQDHTAAAVGLEHSLGVQLLFLAEVVVDRREDSPPPVDRSNGPARIEPLLGKLFTGRLEQSCLRLVGNGHDHLALKRPFQTAV